MYMVHVLQAKYRAEVLYASERAQDQHPGLGKISIRVELSSALHMARIQPLADCPAFASLSQHSTCMLCELVLHAHTTPAYALDFQSFCQPRTAIACIESGLGTC